MRPRNLKCEGLELNPDPAIPSSPQAKRGLILNKPPWPSPGKGRLAQRFEPLRCTPHPACLLLRNLSGTDHRAGAWDVSILPWNSLFRLRLGNPSPHRPPPSQKLLPSSLLVVFLRNSRLDSYNRLAEKRVLLKPVCIGAEVTGFYVSQCSRETEEIGHYIYMCVYLCI